VHLRGRRMLFIYAILALTGSVLAAAAPSSGLFIAGHVLQGFATSLMLIAAVPPLVIGWPVGKMPITAVVMNMCIFGAVAVGPVIGGVQAGAGDWRPLFWIVAGVSALALVFVVLTFEDQEPQDRNAPWDWVAIALAGAGCAAAFFGASELQTHAFDSAIVLVPLLAGLAMLVGLVLFEYYVENPLMPVRQVASTFPVAGIVMAMCAGAASVAVIELAQTALKSEDPTHVAMLFWPEFGAAAAIAVVFGLLFRTRYIPVLAITGMVVLSAGAAVLGGVTKGSDALVLIGSGLVGLGVGASVSPALFIAGFSCCRRDCSECSRSPTTAGARG
jgi:MFS family permease